ncbi:MAG: polysaccharide biosynthesis protein [Xanthomonadales bacterium]|nr:polysaccharide biosynthesis protein [Xanthomonadales bacterium]
MARLGPAALVVLEHSEYALYRIEQELRRDFPELVLLPLLGDVCETAACREAIARGRVEIVFHAAAYKQVPLLEGQLRAALRNNLLGTARLAEAAAEAGVESFVLISTDKAVRPVSVMGASKRAAERLLAALAAEGRARTRFLTVRFGNVLDSAGSVVPLFREQIARGGPVTVTHPEIERYFMTIPEACQLILQAAVIGQGGEILALDMGEPVKIRELAEQMIRLAGKVPGRDVQIVYTGLRPGEKLYEELFHPTEERRRTRHPKILECRPAGAPLADWRRLLAETARAVAEADEARLRELLERWVPDFEPSRAAEARPAQLRLVGGG